LVPIEKADRGLQQQLEGLQRTGDMTLARNLVIAVSYKNSSIDPFVTTVIGVSFFADPDSNTFGQRNGQGTGLLVDRIVNGETVVAYHNREAGDWHVSHILDPNLYDQRPTA